jgi:hypothetical protein
MFARTAPSTSNCERDTVDPAQFETLVGLVRDKNKFLARILVTRSKRCVYDDHLLWGFSQIVSFCEDLDRLLEEAGAFPLLQSAMWNYHSDVFSVLGNRLPSCIMHLVEAFGEWEAEELSQEERLAIYDYIKHVKSLIERLSSDTYGGLLNNRFVQPIVAAPAMSR